MTTIKDHWSDEYRSLIGKTVHAIRHLQQEEIEEFMWYEDERDTTVIEFTDGTYAILMRDDEGNGAGAMEIGSYKPIEA